MMNCIRFLAVSFLLTISSSCVRAGTKLTDKFNYPDGLVTNEFAFWNPKDPAAKISKIWALDSGSLFAEGKIGWSGIPDNIGPDAQSANGTNSAVFRLTTKQNNFLNVAVSVSVLNQGLSSTSSTPQQAWDGLHLWLRYQSETHLYYASVNRRDNKVIIKKKVPGGPSNGGTYHELSPYVAHPVPYNKWQQIRVTVKNEADGSVTIELFSDNARLISVTDDGKVGGPPITKAGKVGIRGDNANLKFDNFSVSPL